MVAGRAMLVENNYGYTGPTSVENGGVTTPGFARVDINPAHHEYLGTLGGMVSMRDGG